MAGANTVRASEKKGSDAIDKAPPAFTIDDLLAELRPDEIPDGVTVSELCDQIGWPRTKNNKTKMQKKIADKIALGLWEYAGRKTDTDITGQTRPIPAYRPVSGGGEE